jgi:uncharacterized protein YutE (UPF0331/DUF86 family)
LRHIADREAIPVAKYNPNELTKSLFIYGVLAKEQYQALQAGVQARNMVIHGYEEPKALAQTVDQLLSVAARLQQRYLA